MSTGKTGLLGAYLQSDLDCTDPATGIKHSIIGLPSSSALLSIDKTIYVDATNGTSGGMRGTTKAFQTLPQAIAVLQSGDTIQMRPGTYSAGGTINVAGVSLLGNGAKIVVPEGTTQVLNITASRVTVSDLEINCSRVSSNATPAHGVIEVTSTYSTIKNVYVHDAVGYGVFYSGQTTGAKLYQSEISNATNGVILSTGNVFGSAGILVTDISITDNRIVNNRDKAISLDNQYDGIVQVTKGFIVARNQLRGNVGVNSVGIELFGGHSEAVVANNMINGAAYAVSLNHTYRASVVGNEISNGTYAGIEVADSSEITVTGNIIDGRNDLGTAVMANGIVSSALNVRCDNITICGNTVSNLLATTGVGIAVEETDVSNVVGNIIYGSSFTGILFKESTSFRADGNMLVINSAPFNILVDGGSYGCSIGRIINNTFARSGSAGIGFSETQAHAIDDIIIKNNDVPGSTATPTVFFSAGLIFTNISGGGTLTNKRVIGNLPLHPTGQYGWINDDFELDDSGTINSTAVRVFSDSGNLYFQYGSGGHIYVRNAAGTVLGTWSSTGLDSNGLSVGGSVVETVNHKAVANGYPSLDGSGKVPAAQLPTLSAGTIASTSAVLKGDGAGNAIASTPTGTGDNVLATSPTLITPVLGVATATSINGLTVTTSTGTLTVPNGVVATAPEITSLLGFRHIPQNSKSAAYTTVLADSGKNIYHPVGDNNARTFTIDSNANVAYPIGTGMLFTNMAVANLTVAITSDTLTLLGTGTTGSRTIAQYGRLYVEKDTSTSWIGIPIANVT